MRAPSPLPFAIFSEAMSGALGLSLLAAAWAVKPQPAPAPELALETTRPPMAELAQNRDANPLGPILIGLRSGSRNLTVAYRQDPPAEADEASRALSQAAGDAPNPGMPALRSGETAPLPPQRPPELAANYRISAPSARASDQTARAAQAAAPSDNRSFIEKVFGGPQQSGPALAYAAPETGLLDAARGVLSSPSSSRFDRFTAVYDISAHTVYLPDGTRLEAHSGLGSRLDNPRFVHERMHGPTPPNVYELAPREQPFHGVQALRLKPVGAGNLFGRTGLLAHTYMLGPKGDSNGCVSFRNYDAFLRAYQNGQVRRLAVVANLN